MMSEPRPKLVADQLGQGLGVNLDVYTVAALNQRQEAIQSPGDDTYPSLRAFSRSLLPASQAGSNG